MFGKVLVFPLIVLQGIIFGFIDIKVKNEITRQIYILGDKAEHNRKVSLISLTLFRMGFFWATHGWGGEGDTKKPPSLKICHTNPTMMKLGTVIPYLRRSKIYINHVTPTLNSANISINININIRVGPLCPSWIGIACTKKSELLLI